MNSIFFYLWWVVQLIGDWFFLLSDSYSSHSFEYMYLNIQHIISSVIQQLTWLSISNIHLMIHQSHTYWYITYRLSDTILYNMYIIYFQFTKHLCVTYDAQLYTYTPYHTIISFTTHGGTQVIVTSIQFFQLFFLFTYVRYLFTYFRILYVF